MGSAILCVYLYLIILNHQYKRLFRSDFYDFSFLNTYSINQQHLRFVGYASLPNTGQFIKYLDCFGVSGKCEVLQTFTSLGTFLVVAGCSWPGRWGGRARVSIFSKNHVPPKCHLSQSASFAKIQEFPQSIFGKLLSINDLGLFLGVYISERTQ